MDKLKPKEYKELFNGARRLKKFWDNTKIYYGHIFNFKKRYIIKK